MGQIANLLPCSSTPNKFNALLWLRLLSWLSPSNSPSFLGLAGDLGVCFPGLRFSQYFAGETPVTTAAACFVGDEDVLWFLIGTSGLQIPALCASAIAGDYNNNQGLIGVYLQGAQNLVNSVGSVNIPSDRTHWYISHSYGSGTSQGLAWIMSQTKSPAKQYAISFGSPRVGNQQWASRSNNILTNIRYCTQNDCVPRLFPHSEEAPLINAIVGFSGMWNLNQLVHVSNCYLINGTSIAQATNPTVPCIIIEPSLAALAAGSNWFGAQAHTIRSYQDALIGAYDPCGSLPLGPNRTQLPPDMPEQVSQREMSRLAQQAVQQLPQGGLPGGVPMLVPTSPADIATHRHEPPSWNVYYAGQRVAMFATKREAKRCCREINRSNGTHWALLGQ